MTRSLAIDVYRPGADDGPIRVLIDACYGDQGVSEDRFRHWHFGLAGAIDGMAVARAGADVVGIQPMEVVPHRLGGRRVLAGVLTGVMVHPDWRRQGVFGQLVAGCERRAWEAGAELVWTMPNDLSLPGFAKAGYRNPGERRLYLWSPRPAALLRGRLPSPLARLAGALLKPVVGRSPRPDARCAAREVARPGGVEAGVAAEFARSWPGLVQERDEAWLEWRHRGHTSPAYRTFVSTDVAGRPAAWAVTTRERREGRLVGYILDMVGTDGEARFAAGRAALDALRDEGVDLVLGVAGAAPLVEAHRRLGFAAVPTRLAPKRFHTVYRANPSRADSPRVVESIGGWYLTLADWDML